MESWWYTTDLTRWIYLYAACSDRFSFVSLFSLFAVVSTVKLHTFFHCDCRVRSFFTSSCACRSRLNHIWGLSVLPPSKFLLCLVFFLVCELSVCLFLTFESACAQLFIYIVSVKDQEKADSVDSPVPSLKYVLSFPHTPPPPQFPRSLALKWNSMTDSVLVGTNLNQSMNWKNKDPSLVIKMLKTRKLCWLRNFDPNWKI
jgi:hypothetical protein